LANTLITAIGKAICADRIRATPATYTSAPKQIGHGGYTTGTKTGSVTDQALLFERETRVAGTESTVTTTYTGDTYQVQGTISVTATYSANEAMLNDTAGSASFHTTLNGSLTSAATSIVVNNAGPSAAFVAQIEDEVINVTAGGNTTTWTATRGYQGSTAAAHATSCDVGKVTGNMFMSATFTGIGVNSGDSIQYTVKTQFS
jgi:hypothetical protein